MIEPTTNDVPDDQRTDDVKPEFTPADALQNLVEVSATTTHSIDPLARFRDLLTWVRERTSKTKGSDHDHEAK